MSPPAADSTKTDEPKCSQRKINKPLIEKRRRARINDCLVQLKTIVLEANESKSPRPSKLEKADILEMTVEFVKNKLNLGHDGKTGKRSSNDDNLDYVAGYSKCLSEISKFLEQTKPGHYTLQQDIVDHVSEKLRSHLTNDGNLGHISNKLPIPPLCKNSQEQKCVTDEAIDLRVSNCDSTEQEKVMSGVTEISKPITNQKLVTDQFVNQSTPMGLLCGGQVMLLVQLPQSVASPHVQIQNIQSVNQSQNNMSMIGIQPLSFTSKPQMNPIVSGTDLNIYQTNSVGLPQLPVSNNPFQQTQMGNITHPQIQNGSSFEHRNHWRPW